MALTKIGSGGIENVTNAANATFLTIDASEQITVASEGGATTTSVQQGLAKHWVRFDQINNTLGDTFNSSSFTDVATGQSLFTRTSNLANDDYVGFITSEIQVTYTNTADSLLASSTQLSTSFMSLFHIENGTQVDTRTVCIMALGDLA